MTKSIRTLLTLLMAVVMTAGFAFGDVVKLKNGKTYEGEIVEQTDDIVILKIQIGSIEKLFTLYANEIESIDTGESTGDDTPVETTRPVAGTENTERPSTPERSDFTGKKTVFVIPMHGGVGEKFRKDKLEESINAARKHNPDVIVLEINSPGGALSEVVKLRDYLAEVRDEFRIVTWVKSAISAAAMTALNTREIYFMREGHMGAATAWRPTGNGGEAVTGEALEEILEFSRRMSEAAGYNPFIIQAMIKKDYALSADREVLPNGEIKVTWYDSEDGGDHLLCREGEILTFTASEAEFFGVSKGTADNEQELARMLNLDGWHEVSQDGREIQERWWALVDEANREIPRLAQRYQYLLGRGGSEREVRRQLGEAANTLRELIRWLQRDPAFADMYSFRIQDLERELREILRRIDN
ncbi:MAG: hypothetical protein ACF8PN_00125 [Phycisphaerales bacterium]